MKTEREDDQESLPSTALPSDSASSRARSSSAGWGVVAVPVASGGADAFVPESPRARKPSARAQLKKSEKQVSKKYGPCPICLKQPEDLQVRPLSGRDTVGMV